MRKTKSNFKKLFFSPLKHLFFDGQIKTTGTSPFFHVCLALISNFFNKHYEEEGERGDDLAEKGKSGDKDSDKTSVNKEVTELCEQVKRAIMHGIHYNALTTHSCFL